MSSSVFPADKYKFIKFRRSKKRDKKYDAVLRHIATGREKVISFGGIRPNGTPYPQYKDSTGLKLYSHLDHLDEARRQRYRNRHKGEGNSTRKYSAGYFSYWYLWVCMVILCKLN